jgi:hypothetical protein
MNSERRSYSSLFHLLLQFINKMSIEAYGKVLANTPQNSLKVAIENIPRKPMLIDGQKVDTSLIPKKYYCFLSTWRFLLVDFGLI